MRLILLFALITPAFGNTGVVKITASHAGVQALGSGVCLDRPCVHVLTNYHVALFLGGGMRVEGTAVNRVTLFTGPDDFGAQEMEAAFGTYKYNPAKDLALLRLATALPEEFSGAPFAAYQPRVGQDVVRRARFGDETDVVAGKIVSDSVTHASAKGALTPMPRHFLLDCASRPGNSGGVVSDMNGNVIGMVAMRSTNVLGETGTIVVSAALVAEFLRSVDKKLWKALFPASTVAAAPAQPEPMPAGLSALVPSTNLRQDAIRMLRERARQNAVAMQNLVAVESIDTWGQNQARRSSLYQIALYSDGQKYQRMIANGVPAKQPVTSAIAWPRMTGVVPGEQWSIVSPMMNDADLVYEGSGSYEGGAVNVFRYTSSAIGCASRYMGRKIYAACSGVVIADREMNALLVTQRMNLPAGDASVIRWSEKFARITVAGRSVLLPSSLTMSGDFRTGKSYFAAARWSSYKAFAAESAFSAE